jgi:hypothetical protein
MKDFAYLGDRPTGSVFPERDLHISASLKLLDSSGVLAGARILPVEEVGNKIGAWQQKQYRRLKFEKIELGPGTIHIESREPFHENMIFADIELQKQVSLKFYRDQATQRWTFEKIEGLKVEGKPIDKITSSGDKIYLWSGSKKQEFGQPICDFIRNLFEPLTRENLRR